MTMPGAPDSTVATPYYAALDGLRGYAAGLVVLLHLMGALLTEYFKVPESRISATSDVPGIAVMAFLGDGHHGVEIFFVLSGFLMARLGATRTSWREFYLRRIRRIYPAFLASLAVAATLYCLTYGWEFRSRDFLLNIVFANAWPGSGVLAYNHVSWTLGYEFAFYLTLPALFVLPCGAWRMAGAGVVMLGLLTMAPPPAVRMASLFAGFMLGCASDAAIVRRVRVIPTGLVLAIYGGFVVAKAAGWASAAVFFTALSPLVCLLVARVAFDGGLAGRVFSSAPMAWLGRLSYSIYLWHPLVIALVVYDLLPLTGLAGMPEAATAFVCIACVLLTLGVAAASYRWIEAPFLRHRDASALRSKAAPGERGRNCGPGAVAVKLAPPAMRTAPMTLLRSRLALMTVPALMLALASGCGMDPPPSSGDAKPAGGSATPAVIRGVKPALVESLAPVAESSPTVRCNIETIGGENLEGVRPTVNTKATVGIAGWYFAPGSAPAAATTADSSAEAAHAPGDSTAAVAPGDARATSSGIQLVISNEDASKTWVVQVPARTERPDVSDFLKEPAALRSGFAFDVDLSGLAPGAYNMHLSDAAHSAASVCGLGRGFLVE